MLMASVEAHAGFLDRCADLWAGRGKGGGATEIASVSRAASPAPVARAEGFPVFDAQLEEAAALKGEKAFDQIMKSGADVVQRDLAVEHYEDLWKAMEESRALPLTPAGLDPRVAQPLMKYREELSALRNASKAPVAEVASSGSGMLRLPGGDMPIPKLKTGANPTVEAHALANRLKAELKPEEIPDAVAQLKALASENRLSRASYDAGQMDSHFLRETAEILDGDWQHARGAIPPELASRAEVAGVDAVTNIMMSGAKGDDVKRATEYYDHLNNWAKGESLPAVPADLPAPLRETLDSYRNTLGGLQAELKGGAKVATAAPDAARPLGLDFSLPAPGAIKPGASATGLAVALGDELAKGLSAAERHALAEKLRKHALVVGAKSPAKGMTKVMESQVYQEAADFLDDRLYVPASFINNWRGKREALVKAGFSQVSSAAP